MKIEQELPSGVINDDMIPDPSGDEDLNQFNLSSPPSTSSANNDATNPSSSSAQISTISWIISLLICGAGDDMNAVRDRMTSIPAFYNMATMMLLSEVLDIV